MREGCASVVATEQNPGAWLGAVIGSLARRGRDKLTLIASPGLESFGLWVEQLLAESTGKNGKGIVPVAGEPLADPGSYGRDRLFVYLRLDSADDALDRKARALEDAGHPLVHLHLSDEYYLGQEFFRWETATALAGSLLGINPFDEPNVQESKDNTASIITAYQTAGRLPLERALVEGDGLSLYADAATVAALGPAAADSLPALLAAHLRSLRLGDYLALMAYLPPSGESDEALQAIRTAIRDAFKVATTVGYGPRFLHSTGQLHKGGPNSGVFLQLTVDDPQDLSIPGER